MSHTICFNFIVFVLPQEYLGPINGSTVKASTLLTFTQQTPSQISDPHPCQSALLLNQTLTSIIHNWHMPLSEWVDLSSQGKGKFTVESQNKYQLQTRQATEAVAVTYRAHVIPVDPNYSDWKTSSHLVQHFTTSCRATNSLRTWILLKTKNELRRDLHPTNCWVVTVRPTSAGRGV